jgi:hypothetical protein
MSFGTALYYPYIDIEEPCWLRSAVLFWDGLHTIVPSSIRRPYRDQDTSVLHEEGYLTPLNCDLHGDLLNDLGRRVMGFLQSPERMHRLFGESLETPDSNALIHGDKVSRGLLDQFRMARIHPQKMSPDMRALFANADARESNFLLVDSRFAALYMAALAARLARDIGAAPLSSELGAFGFNIHTILDEVASDRESAASAAMMSVVIESLVIDASIPITRLLRFRRTHEHQLQSLANEFEKLSAEFEKVEDVREMREKAGRRYRRRVRPELERLKEALADARIGAAWAGFRNMVTLSTAAGGAAAHFLGWPTNILLGAGAFATITEVAVQSHFVGKKIRRDSPYTYLLDVQNRFTLPAQFTEE